MDQRRVDGEGGEVEVDGLGRPRLHGSRVGIVGWTGRETTGHGAQSVELVGGEEASRLAGCRRGGEQGAHPRGRSESEQSQTSGGLQEGAPVHFGEGT